MPICIEKILPCFCALSPIIHAANAQSILNELLDIKMNRPEIHEIPRIPELNAYLENSFSEVQERLNSMENDQNDDWSALNEMFLTELGLKNA